MTTLQRCDRDQRPTLRILTYHRVDWAGDDGLYPGLISAEPPVFAQQMSWLKTDYCPVSLQDVIEAFRGQRRLPQRAVLVTFDDAYRDFATHAWPVMRQRAIPVVLFVPTAFPDQPQRAFWWDRLYQAFQQPTAPHSLDLGDKLHRLHTIRQRRQAYLAAVRMIKSLPHREAMQLVERLCDQLHHPPCGSAVLGWEQLRQLSQQGVTLAPHTRTHPLLSRCCADQVREEVEGSRDDLRQQIGHCPDVLAYPAGGHNAEVVRVVGELGFELAMTTRRGLTRLDRANRLALRRINVSRTMPATLVQAQMLSRVAPLVERLAGR
jgi:peptidoglycan/xylan/chitin deacetylase (PgdA/CDA1 family)